MGGKTGKKEVEDLDVGFAERLTHLWRCGCEQQQLQCLDPHARFTCWLCACVESVFGLHFFFPRGLPFAISLVLVIWVCVPLALGVWV